MTPHSLHQGHHIEMTKRGMAVRSKVCNSGCYYKGSHHHNHIVIIIVIIIVIGGSSGGRHLSREHFSPDFNLNLNLYLPFFIPSFLPTKDIFDIQTLDRAVLVSVQCFFFGWVNSVGLGQYPKFDHTFYSSIIESLKKLFTHHPSTFIGRM